VFTHDDNFEEKELRRKIPKRILREMTTRNISRGKGLPARKADNLTVICEPIV
jgi:hypothetical protein